MTNKVGQKNSGSIFRGLANLEFVKKTFLDDFKM